MLSINIIQLLMVLQDFFAEPTIYYDFRWFPYLQGMNDNQLINNN